MPSEPTTTAYLSTRDLAAFLAGRRINASPSTLSRWTQDGGPWGFPSPDQKTAATPLWRLDRVAAWADRYGKVQHIQGYRLAGLLRAYAAAGAALGPAEPEPRARPTVPEVTTDIQEGIAHLVQAHREREAVLKADFERLVAASEARLGVEPLQLPALVNLIPADDENAVSDILAEVLKLLPKTTAFGIFGLSSKHPSETIPQRVEREWPVAEGHAGRSGRLDLVAIYPDGEWLVIENKVVPAGAADLVKNAGYVRSLDGSRVTYQAVTLVSGDPIDSHGHGFVLMNWRDILLRLRWRLVGIRATTSVPVANQMALLALVGVLERRLLNLRLDIRLSDPETRTYLEDFHNRTPT